MLSKEELIERLKTMVSFGMGLDGYMEPDEYGGWLNLDEVFELCDEAEKEEEKE